VIRHARAGEVPAYARRIAALPGVARLGDPRGDFRGDSRDGYAHLSVIPSVEDVSPESQRLVESIREVPAPGTAMVAGRAAELVDTKHSIGVRLPWALALIAAATLVLLFLMTGSVLVPVKAVVIAALSLTATFGAVVWVFQDGHLSGPLGFTATGTIETSLPVLMFCLAFGLSMDYGVFLLSRVKEEYDRTGDNETAVSIGLQRTGGVVTAAAVVLAIVLAGVGTSQIMNNKMLGLGVALAVVMDATVIRCLLVPSTMAIAGRATWWAPGPLRRFQRRYGLAEAPPDTAPAQAATPTLLNRSH
jgi:RND superfamily putative drug exporter